MPKADTFSPQALALPNLAFEIQTARRIAKGPPLFACLSLITSPFLMMWTITMPWPRPNPIILLKPAQNDTSFYWGLVKSLFIGHGSEFPWRLARHFFDIVQVRLE